MLKIGNRHPARNEVANLGDYFTTKSDAQNAISEILNAYGLDIDWAPLEGDEGTALLPIIAAEPHVMYLDDCDQPQEQTFANGVSFSWYKMRPGKWEIITYIS